eukprot:1193080-Prorocentrum_minimum.AAC.5
MATWEKPAPRATTSATAKRGRILRLRGEFCGSGGEFCGSGGKLCGSGVSSAAQGVNSAALQRTPGAPGSRHGGDLGVRTGPRRRRLCWGSPSGGCRTRAAPGCGPAANWSRQMRSEANPNRRKSGPRLYRKREAP